MTATGEQDRIVHLFDRVEKIEIIAESLDRSDDRRQALLHVASLAIADCAPVRSKVAANLLQLSEPTIRSWVREGVLAEASGRSRVLVLDPERLHEVFHLVRDLREAGKSKGLLDAVWSQLSDHALLERDDLIESIGQMQRGEGHEIDIDELKARRQEDLQRPAHKSARGRFRRAARSS